MAKKPENAASTRGITPKQLRAAVEEVDSYKQKASEAAGNAGQRTGQIVEQYGLDKAAFTHARKLASQEDKKRSATVRASLEYWDKLGFFDQFDIFDSTIDVMRNIVKRFDDMKENPPQNAAGSDGDVVGQMMQ